MIQQFTISGRLAGLNDIIGKTNANRWLGAKLKKDQGHICLEHIVLARLKPVKSPVYIHFDWYEPNERRDPDNTRTGAKFILDALVEARILPQDSRKWVKGLSDSFPPSDAQNPRVTITIEEIDGGPND